MPQRSPYHRIRRRAVLSESIFKSVKSNHSIGSAPLGGLISLAISADNSIVPQLFLHPTRGALTWVLAHRSSSAAVRAGRSLLRGSLTVMEPPQGWVTKESQSFFP